MATKTVQSTIKKPVIRKSRRSLSTLVAKMAKDPELAQEVIANPRKFQKAYNLSDKATRTIKGLYVEDLAKIKVKDPQSFAAGALAADKVAGITTGDIGCYYGG